MTTLDMEKAAAGEGDGRSEMEFTDVQTISDSFETSTIFHIVIDILGFVLFMHHQIPSVLQDISLEFDDLHKEYKDLETVVLDGEMKVSLRRQHIARKREVKHGIRRMEKLMNSIANVKTSLLSLINEAPYIEKVTLVLGPSPLRPLHAYELWFSGGKIVSVEFNRSRVTEALSKKAIRMLLSKGAGSDRNAYSGPAKLFLLVKAPASLNLSREFTPKPDFRFPKKIVPFKLRFKCREHMWMNAQCDNPQHMATDAGCDSQHMETNSQYNGPQTDTDVLLDSSSKNSIWFQCQHVIKGLGSSGSPNEE